MDTASVVSLCSGVDAGRRWNVGGMLHILCARMTDVSRFEKCTLIHQLQKIISSSLDSQEVLLIRDSEDPTKFYPRFGLDQTASFDELDDHRYDDSPV